MTESGQGSVRYCVSNLNRGVNLATSVTVAGNSTSRKRGLLGVERLESGAGLWIAPCEAVHTFGMKLAIDVAFLDRNLRVRKMVCDLKPCRVAMSLRAFSVLELASGAIAATGTRVGDRLRFQPL